MAKSYTDAELLVLVAEEKRNSVGLDDGDELGKARAQALDYAKGEMKDVKALPGRSKAVSTDVNDAVETALPDLIEIFLGGDDVAVFQPIGQEDEPAARQETDYVQHVVFNENPGFLNLYSAFKDALTVKTGVFHWWWEEKSEDEEHRYEGQSAASIEMLLADGGEVVDSAPNGLDPLTGEQLFDVTVRSAVPYGCLKIRTVNPDNFAVARDTVALADTTYCVMETFPRAQDLIADGHDPAKVQQLKAAYHDDNEDERDTAGENDEANSDSSELRTVQINTHVVRVVEDGKPKLYRLVTDADEKVLLSKDVVEEVPFAALTPYLVPHRFYGRSLADLLIEVQKIKTALTRMFLDSGYFALNQRYEVAQSQANQFTVADLLRNEPGVPVRSVTGNAVRAIQAGSLNFPALDALEHFSTVGETRTGVVRNAQGLNPDALHDTAKGMSIAFGAAQKRLRLIARVFAETGLKDLFLGAHAMLRRHSTKAATVRLRNEWVEVDPSSWGRRKDMTVELGVGAGGREHEIAMLMQAGAWTEKLLNLQGGQPDPSGFVTPDNVYNIAKRFYERGLGFKSADPFVSDPKKAPPQEQAPPQPDPEMVKAQQQIMLDREKAEADIELERQKMLAEVELERERMALEARLSVVQSQLAPKPQSGMRPVQMGGDIG